MAKAKKVTKKVAKKVTKKVNKFQTGGIVPGEPIPDTVPVVVNPEAAVEPFTHPLPKISSKAEKIEDAQLAINLAMRKLEAVNPGAFKNIIAILKASSSDITLRWNYLDRREKGH